MKFIFKLWIFFLFPIFLLSINKLEEKRVEKGGILFSNNCLPCHTGGKNLILPEKNLRKETLDANGINSLKAITYQILNGKNGMPAFGGRLTENEIENIARYVLKESEGNFQEKEFFK